jgi:hypothetical protein
MSDPPDPPTLEYATPEDKPVAPTHPVVGILGFVLYGVLCLLFSIPLMLLGREVLWTRRPPDEVFIKLGMTHLALWTFCVWRAIAAFRGAMGSRNKR